jgi:hypothetical protein
MNCIQLINSLLLAAESTTWNNTAPKNAIVNDATASIGDRGSEEETEFSEEAVVEETGGSDNFEFVVDPNWSVRDESSDAESEFFSEAVAKENRNSATFESVAENQEESSDASSELFDEATVEENGDSDGNCSRSNIGDENSTPVHQEANVAVALKIVTSHPMRNISRKTRTKPQTAVEIRAFQAHVKHCLMQLFGLSNCFNRNERRFMLCNCLKMLEQECCLDSLAARIGMFIV